MTRDNTCWKCQGEKYINCYTCGGIGNFPCTICRAEGWFECKKCGGSGRRGIIDCHFCRGQGGHMCRVCNGNCVIGCHRCGGEGKILCPKCNGTGKYPPFVEQEYTAVKETPKEVVKKQEENGCFFATAIYRDINAPEVRFLRKFRDEALIHNIAGRVFVSLYYAGLGKMLAKIVSYFGEPGRFICRGLMKPIIRQLALR